MNILVEIAQYQLSNQKLSDEDESRFMNWFTRLPWYSEFHSNYGEYPNPNDPNYSYRGAWKAGVEPARYEYDQGRYHWSSQFKSTTHPTMWMEHFMRNAGKDPNEIGIDRIEAERLMRELGWQ